MVCGVGMWYHMAMVVCGGVFVVCSQLVDRSYLINFDMNALLDYHHKGL